MRKVAVSSTKRRKRQRSPWDADWSRDPNLMAWRHGQYSVSFPWTKALTLEISGVNLLRQMKQGAIARRSSPVNPPPFGSGDDPVHIEGPLAARKGRLQPKNSADGGNYPSNDWTGPREGTQRKHHINRGRGMCLYLKRMLTPRNIDADQNMTLTSCGLPTTGTYARVHERSFAALGLRDES